MLSVNLFQLLIMKPVLDNSKFEQGIYTWQYLSALKDSCCDPFDFHLRGAHNRYILDYVFCAIRRRIVIMLLNMLLLGIIYPFAGITYYLDIDLVTNSTGLGVVSITLNELLPQLVSLYS